MKMGCVILASGAAKRFGENKLLADFCGTPLIVHLLKTLHELKLDRVVIVSIYPEIEKLCRSFGFQYVKPDGDGQNDTISAGISQMSGMDGCIFCVGDQPLCEKDSIINLIDAFYKNPKGIIRLFYKATPGNPVIFPKDLFDELKTLPSDTGGSVIIKRYGERLVPVQAQAEYELYDVDTKQNFRELEAAAKKLDRFKSSFLF